MRLPSEPPESDVEDSSEQVRETDYGADLTASEAHPPAVEYGPDTGPRIRRAALILAVVLAVGFVAVRVDRFFGDRRLAAAAREETNTAPTVNVIEAKAVGASQRLALPGQTAAWHSSTIYARVNGFVGKWLADLGDAVQKGQVLAIIETPDLDAQLAAARAQLQAAEAQVLVRRAETDLARTTDARWRDSPKGVVSDQEREQKRADYESAAARLKSAQAEVALDAARVEQYTALSRFKQVTAPFDGVVSERDIDIGNLVTAGSTSATTPLYVITQGDPMRVFVDVPQSAAAAIMEPSTPVQILTGGASHVYKGNVTRTSQAINAQARTLRVEIDIPNTDRALVPGMYVKVAFELQPKGAVQIPAAALVFRSGGPEVACVDRQGRVNFRRVSIARDDGGMVELDSGVQAGDRLALNVGRQIGEGERVHANLIDGPTTAPQISSTRR